MPRRDEVDTPRSPIRIRIEKFGELLDEVDLDSDRPSINIHLAEQRKNSLFPIPTKWKRAGLIAFLVGSALAGLGMGLKGLF